MTMKCQNENNVYSDLGIEGKRNPPEIPGETDYSFSHLEMNNDWGDSFHQPLFHS